MSDIVERLEAWRYLARYANGGWDMPPHVTAALARAMEQAIAALAERKGEI